MAYELPWSQRFFLPLRGSGSIISCREKNQEKPLRPEYLRVDFLHIIGKLLEILSDECVSTKLGVTGNFVSSLYLLIGILYIFLYVDLVTKN